MPATTPEEEIRNIFSGSNLEIVEAKSELGDLWYVKFNSNEDAKKAFAFLLEKNSTSEKQIKYRIKDGRLLDFLTSKTPSLPAGQQPENVAPMNAFIPSKDFGKRPESGNFAPYGQQYAYNKFDGRKNNRKPRYENQSYQNQSQDYQNNDDQSKPFRRNFNNNYNNKYNNYNNADDRRKNNMKRLPKKPKKPVPDFDQSAFPPLPAVEKTGGYEGSFLHYTKAQIIGVFQKTVGDVAEQEIHKPQNWEKFVDVLAASHTPNKTLEMTKPLPNTTSHSIIQFPPEKPVKAEGEKKVEEVEQPSILVEDEPALFTSFAEAAITTKDIALNEKGSKHKLEIQVQNKKKNEKKDNSQKPAENAQQQQPSKQGDAKSQKGGKQFNKGSRNFDNKKGFPKREKSYREKDPKQTSDSKAQPQEQHSAQEETKPQEQTQQPQEPQVEISYASVVAEKKEKSE